MKAMGEKAVLLNEKDGQVRRESNFAFGVIILGIGLNMLLWGIASSFSEGQVIPPWIITVEMEAMGLLMFYIIYRNTAFSLKDTGLLIQNIRKTMKPAVLTALAGLAVLITVKLVISRISVSFFPIGAPFWDWRVAKFSSLFYPFTVILQEFLARSVMQRGIRNFFTGKHSAELSVLLSSVLFGLLHIAYGPLYMLAAAVLMGALGCFYEKQKNIWGVSLIHFVLGQAAVFLRLLA